MLQVVRARYEGGYRVWVEFNDGAAGVVDIADALWGPAFEPLKDIERFKRLGVSDVLHTLAWENGPDLRRNIYARDWPSRPGKRLVPIRGASGEGKLRGRRNISYSSPDSPAAAIFRSPGA